MKNKICGIYCIENMVNGKKYIGQSINIENRWIKHKRELNNNVHYNVHLQAAWNKYKEENFNFYVIIECQESELDYYEKFYIKEFNLLDKNVGYNINPGGAFPREFSEEELNKRSESIKKWWKIKSKDEKDKIMFALKNGHKEWEKNCTPEEKSEVYNKIVEKYLFKTEAEKNAIKEKRVNTMKKTISKRDENRKKELSDIYKRSNKRRWDMSGDDVKEALRQCIIKKVYCPELNKSFDSIKTASNFTGALSPNIVKVCNHERNYAGKLDDGTKLTWRYA